MSFGWTQQSIAWFLDASVYTEFHRKLARKLLPFLSRDDTVCDFGCGLGRLDLALSAYVSSITAVDVEAKVIERLTQSAQDLGCTNLHARVADSNSVEEKFDVGIMSFFGNRDYSDSRFGSICNKKLIKIVNGKNESTLYPSEYRTTKKSTVSDVKQRLEANGAGFNLIEAQIEFGQPLRSVEQARDFVLYHAPMAGQADVENFLAKNSVMTGKKDFPIYIPNPKQIGIFIINQQPGI